MGMPARRSRHRERRPVRRFFPARVPFFPAGRPRASRLIAAARAAIAPDWAQSPGTGWQGDAHVAASHPAPRCGWTCGCRPEAWAFQDLGAALTRAKTAVPAGTIPACGCRYTGRLQWLRGEPGQWVRTRLRASARSPIPGLTGAAPQNRRSPERFGGVQRESSHSRSRSRLLLPFLDVMNMPRCAAGQHIGVHDCESLPDQFLQKT